MVDQVTQPVAAASQAGRRKQKVGRVVSDKMNKTVVVAVESLRKHRLYKHTVRVTKRFKAHDELNTCRTGDTVRIEETRPLSKEKRWRVAEILAHDVRATEGVIPASVTAEQG
ncbi:MAG: ribosomal protein [Chloroflexi bacterium]|nr:ribosomal protein [Chloroflexota bacterium]